MAYGGIVARVNDGSVAEEMGLMQGDRILSVNGQDINDIIDLSFALAEETVELFIEKANGEKEILEIEKDYDEDLGVEFETAVFDGIKRCANRCLFCFVDQMAPNLRESLYVKDDDYRLSFLYGNFVTLTNLRQDDLKRIRQLHLSPLYVSVHATDPVLRKKMIGNKQAGFIMEQLTSLVKSGIEMHTQVVLCPEINDGTMLEKTFADLYSLYPGILSMAIVPVGLSKFRDNCFPLRVFTQKEAADLIDTVTDWQQKCRSKHGNNFVYLADEFYLAANRPIPDSEMYDGFPQLENGIGLVRNFLNEWECAKENGYGNGYDSPIYLDIVCGVSAQKILQPLLADICIPNLIIRLVPIINEYFGSNITVSGLLTGQDILSSLERLSGPRTGVIIPGLALRKGEMVFLDNVTPDHLESALQTMVRIAHGASDLHQLLTAWR